MSSRTHVTTIALSTLFVLTSAAGLAGCDLFGEESAALDVLSTHYANPDDDAQPPPSDGGIETDLGWSVYLEDAVITTIGVTLSACDGGNHAIDMFWGAYPEDLSKSDLAVSGLGSVTVPVGEYCEVTVKYGPFEPSSDSDAYDTDIEAAVGTSVYIKGIAVRDDEVVEFEWRTDRPITSVIDVSSIDGGQPLLIEESEVYSTKITVAKSYDRFFDGVDFAALDSIQQDSLLSGTLSLATRVHLGSSISFD